MPIPIEIAESAWRTPSSTRRLRSAAWADVVSRLHAAGLIALDEWKALPRLVPDLPAPRAAPGSLTAPIVAVDRFGNLELLAGRPDLDAAGFTHGDRIFAAVTDAAGVRGRRHPATVCRTFADAAPEGMLVHVDSHGMVAVAVNGGSAARRMGATAGQDLSLERWAP